MSIEKQIKDFIIRKFLKGRGEIADDDSLFANGIIDSFGMLELVAFVEKTFGVRVGPSEVTLSNFDSVRSIAGLVRKKR